MDSETLTINVPEEKARFLNLNLGDIKRVTYNLLALCHIALEGSLKEDCRDEDPSDYQIFNTFISKEIIEPTLDVFLARVKTFKEMQSKFQR